MLRHVLALPAVFSLLSPQKVAATALWLGAKLEEVKEVRDHPRKLLEMVMVAMDRSITRRETPDGRKLPILDLHSKVCQGYGRVLH